MRHRRALWIVTGALLGACTHGAHVRASKPGAELPVGSPHDEVPLDREPGSGSEPQPAGPPASVAKLGESAEPDFTDPDPGTGPAPAAAPTQPSVPSPVAARLRGDMLLGAPLVDADGRQLGEVQDMLVEPATGHLVGAVIACPVDGEPGAERTVHVLPPELLGWTLDGETPRALLGEDDVRFLPESVVSFDERETAEVTGELTGVEPGPWGGLILTLRDGTNLLHRAWVEPACLLGLRIAGEPAADAGDQVASPVTVAARGALTRDATGKLLIVSELRVGEDELLLRDSSGRLLWRPLAAGLRLAGRLVGRELVGSDGARYSLVGWLVEREVPVVSHLLIDVDGVERAVAWELAHWVGDEVAVEHDAAWFRELPPSSP